MGLRLVRRTALLDPFTSGVSAPVQDVRAKQICRSSRPIFGERVIFRQAASYCGSGSKSPKESRQAGSGRTLPALQSLEILAPRHAAGSEPHRQIRATAVRECGPPTEKQFLQATAAATTILAGLGPKCVHPPSPVQSNQHRVAGKLDGYATSSGLGLKRSILGVVPRRETFELAAPSGAC